MMRTAVILLLALCPFLAFGEEQELVEAAATEAVWRDVLARAASEKKPIVVFYRAEPCARCPEFERVTVSHPTIERRLPSVVFAVLPATADAGVALFDRAGVLRARWPLVPDTTNFGIILDSIVTVAPHFERAVQLSEAGAPEADLELANGLARLGRITDARAALARARAHPETEQAAIDALAKLDAGPTPRTVTPRGVVRILPLERQVVSGSHTVKTHVTSAAVARVTFSLDGREVRRVERPPFSATMDFGEVPERHSIRVAAFNQKGQELGRDERVVNEAGETFWLKLLTPAVGPAGGAVRVTMNVRTPAARRVQRVVVSWNDAERRVLTAAPWESTVDIPAGQVGVLRAVAELDDGRTSEDAVLLNAGGMVGEANVQLAELPITIVGRTGTLTPDRITVREGNRVRRVEAVATAAETPLTVGLLIDVSDSMQKTLPDLQEAAIRFLETTLGERDRAFLVTFDSHARLLEPATSDVAQLRRRIMRIRPNGLTALNDAMVLGLLQFEGIKGRRAMIVFSDGVDLTSEYSASEVGELARRVNVPIHVIESIPAEPADGSLERLGPSTGGTAHRLNTLPELPSIYAAIEAALRAQILAFIRTDPATRENEWRSVRVSVAGAGLEVYAPEGYYATW
jgi:Ca-activated chloride channel homolog